MNQHSSLTNHFRSWFDWCFCNRLPVQVLQQIRKKWESRGTHRVYRARVNFLSLTEDSVFWWGNGFDILFWTSQKKDVGIWGIKHILVIHTCHCEGNSSHRGAGNTIFPIPYHSRCQSNFLSVPQNGSQQPFLQSREGQEAAKSLPYIWDEKKFSFLHAKRLDWKAMLSKAHLAEPAWKPWGKSVLAQLQGVHSAPGAQAW